MLEIVVTQSKASLPETFAPDTRSKASVPGTLPGTQSKTFVLGTQSKASIPAASSAGTQSKVSEQLPQVPK